MVLSVTGLHIAFGGEQPFTAVHDLSFSIASGKTLAIVGESGSGKSLTALALMGLLPKGAVMSGDIIFRGEKPASNIVKGKDVGIVFQEPMNALNPVMSVGRQIKEAILQHRQVSRTEARKIAEQWLDKVQLPAPGKIYDRYPHQLSGGQKQRIMIAMAMCNHPALLIADEPTTALDATVQQEIVRLMSYLQQEHHSAMLFITHDLQLAANIGDDVLVLHQGKMVEYGPVKQVFENPQQAYTRALIACRPSQGQKGYPLPVVEDFLSNDDLKENVHPYKPVNDGEPLLMVKNLSVWFADRKSIFGRVEGYTKGVDDVSFEIKKGETLGLVGESGCGKSTLGRALVGLLPVQEGAMLFNSQNIARLSVKGWVEARRHIQMVFQDPYASLNPRMTVFDAITETLKVHSIVHKSELETEVKRLLGLVQLPVSAMYRYPHQFSGGQRQRIGIARALALRPQLLICDESVSALDVSIQAQILNLLKELQSELQLTYLFISHDLSVVYYISDRVMVMQAGKIVESGQAEQVLKQPKDEYTRRLIAAAYQQSFQ